MIFFFNNFKRKKRIEGIFIRSPGKKEKDAQCKDFLLLIG